MSATSMIDDIAIDSDLLEGPPQKSRDWQPARPNPKRYQRGLFGDLDSEASPNLDFDLQVPRARSTHEIFATFDEVQQLLKQELNNDPSPAKPEVFESMNQQIEEIQRLSAMLASDEKHTMDTADAPLPAGFRLSVVIPVYNEKQTIREVLARVLELPVEKEVIIVDDASTDGTTKLLKELDTMPGVHIIFKPKNEGKGAALRTGFRRVTGDVVVVQDADLEYHPRDMLPLLRPIVAGEADVVYGSRFLHEKPHDPSLIHRLGNATLTGLSNLVTGLKLTDMETCYKAFRPEVLRCFEIEQNRFGFEPEVTAKLARRRFRIREVPISYSPRSYAEGKKIGIKDLFSTLWCILRYSVCD